MEVGERTVSADHNVFTHQHPREKEQTRTTKNQRKIV